jgi:hypothetical protein
MNVQRDEFDYDEDDISSRNAPYWARYFLPSFIEAVEGDVVVLTSAGYPFATSIIARGFQGLDPDNLFLVTVKSAITADDFKPLIVLPFIVFESGQLESPNNFSAADDFRPSSGEMEPVPANMRFPDSDYFENRVVKGRRFSRLSAAGLAADAAAAEAAQRAAVEWEAEQQERLAAEVEAARLTREGEAREAEEARQREEQAKFDAWLESLPIPPGILVVNIKLEVNPRVGQVKYDGLLWDAAGWRFKEPAAKRPSYVMINYGTQPDAELSIERSDLTKMIVPYCGTDVPLGARVSRAQVLGGCDDPFPPRCGDLVRATFEVEGKECSIDVGENFLIEHALEFLEKESPDQSVRVPSTDYDEDQERDSEDHSYGRRTVYETKSQSVAERYSSLYGYGARLGGHWTKFNWSNHDRKLLAAEDQRRITANEKWKLRKKALIRLMELLNASISKEGAPEFYDGMSCRVVLTEDEFDLVRNFLDRECNCNTECWYERDELDTEFVRSHSLRPGRLEDALEIWRATKGSPQRFMGSTLHLSGDHPVIEFLVEAFIQAGVVTLLVGPAKLGKTSLALDLARRVAIGAPLAGLKVTQGKAAFLYGEGSSDSIAKQIMDAGHPGSDLEVIDAHQYGNGDLEIGLDEALDDLRDAGFRFLVVDSIEAFVQNSSDGGAAQRIMDKLGAFASDTGAAVLLLHHDTKDVTAENARSAKQVAGKMKGSGRFLNAARGTVTLHREGDLRVVTLTNANILITVPRLQNSLKFDLDRDTGIWLSVNQAKVGLGERPLGPGVSAPRTNRVETAAPAVTEDAKNEADAREAAPVINRLQKEIGRKLAFAGAKSLYGIKGKGDLPGWSRANCERTHRLAVELGLIEPA